jgi:hypothetical protein
MKQESNVSELILEQFKIFALYLPTESLPASAKHLLTTLRVIAERNPRLPLNYKEYIQSKEWEKTRKTVLQWQQNKCGVCGSAENLHVHHILYDNFGAEKYGDCIGLCLRCHAFVHPSGLIFQQWLKLEQGMTLRVLERVLGANAIGSILLVVLDKYFKRYPFGFPENNN